MRTLKVGCVVVVVLVLIGVAGIWIWASRPPYLKVPVRQYPRLRTEMTLLSKGSPISVRRLSIGYN